MKDFISVSPLKILEQSSRRGLGPGNLGVLIARAGVGKTACLIHIALDRIFRGEKLIHVSLEEGPEKVTAYYNVIYYDLLKALNLPDDDEYRMRIDRNRMILAYLNQSFELERLEANLKNLAERLDFRPNTIIIDGLDFEKAGRDMLEGLRKTGRAFGADIWLSALSHRHITETNERGIPYPCAAIDDLLSIVIQLVPEPSGVFLRLLKDHDKPGNPDISVRLDPNTFLALDQKTNVGAGLCACPNKMKVNCQEHRKSMALLGLKLRLKEAPANAKERKEIEKQIAILEKELDLD